MKHKKKLQPFLHLDVKVCMNKFILTLFMFCCTLAFGQDTPLKLISGEYARNIADGWRNYTDEYGNTLEVMPETPRMQYITLKKNGTFIFHFHDIGTNEHIWRKGKWKMEDEQLLLHYKLVKNGNDGKYMRIQSIYKEAYTIKNSIHAAELQLYPTNDGNAFIDQKLLSYCN